MFAAFARAAPLRAWKKESRAGVIVVQIERGLSVGVLAGVGKRRPRAAWAPPERRPFAAFAPPESPQSASRDRAKAPPGSVLLERVGGRGVAGVDFWDFRERGPGARSSCAAVGVRWWRWCAPGSIIPRARGTTRRDRGIFAYFSGAGEVRAMGHPCAPRDVCRAIRKPTRGGQRGLPDIRINLAAAPRHRAGVAYPAVMPRQARAAPAEMISTC
jgi:hypothetical protein